MLVTCWSVKGGSGTTVVAAALALLAAERSRETWLVDVAGDSPAALGAPEPAGPGIGDWLAAPDSVGPEAVARLAQPVSDRLALVPAGDHASPDDRRWCRLVEALQARGVPTVVDLGVQCVPDVVRRGAALDLLVIRPCYMALRRAAALGRKPTGIVLVDEPGRSLRGADVVHTIGVPIVAEVSWDPTVARAVDSGLLAGSLPRSLRGALEGLRWPG